MAQLHNKQQLQGLIGPLYVRNLNGKTIVQSRSVNPKQSNGTKASSRSFVYAVAQSKRIRQALLPLLKVGTDAYAAQRLTGALHKAFHFEQGYQEHYTLFNADLTELIGFEFHSGSPFEHYLPVRLPFEFTDGGAVRLEPVYLPPLERNQLPVSKGSAELAIFVLGFSPEPAVKPITEVFGFELGYYIPAQIALESQTFPMGTCVFVLAQLLVSDGYTVLGSKNYCNDKRFNPSQILWTGVV